MKKAGQATDSYRGGVYRNRTGRLFHAMEALYQMS